MGIDEDSLREIASKTGGKYFRAESTEALRAVYKEIDQLEKTEREEQRYLQYHDLFRTFLGISMGLLVLDLILNYTWENYRELGTSKLHLPWGFSGRFSSCRKSRRMVAEGTGIDTFVSQDRAKELTSHMPTWEYCTRSLLIISAVILGSLALASPRWGYILEKSNATSLDIIIAIDTSRSMLAEDLSPNRMKRTQLAIQELMKLGQGDRFGLIPFAGSAFLQCPLTVDQEALRQHVDLINVDLIPNGGTNLGEAIKAASESFAEHEEDSHKVLVLFSDGEDHDPNALSVAEETSSEGMRIFTIGVGTSEGELIPVKYCPSCDSANTPTRSRCRICNAYLLRQQQFIRDEEGNVVRSRINEGMLEDIAESTGGFYLNWQVHAQWRFCIKMDSHLCKNQRIIAPWWDAKKNAISGRCRCCFTVTGGNVLA